MTNLYSVFVRYERYTDDDHDLYSYYNGEPPIVEDYLGSFGTRSAAEAVATKVKLDDYSVPEWDEDVWTNFAFVYEHRLNAPLDKNAVSGEGDRIRDTLYKMWKVSPAGLAHRASVEKQRRDTEARKESNLAAKKERVREMARVARVARAAKKAALVAESN
jgi:hypothetical protein